MLRNLPIVECSGYVILFASVIIFVKSQPYWKDGRVNVLSQRLLSINVALLMTLRGQN